MSATDLLSRVIRSDFHNLRPLGRVVVHSSGGSDGGEWRVLPSERGYLFESLGVSPAVHVVLTCAVTTLAFSKPFSTGKRRDGMSRAGGVRVGERSPHSGDTES